MLVHAVDLLERKGGVLRVSGLEAVDGTPLVDIKPYVPHYFKVEDIRLSDWMNRTIRELSEGGRADAWHEGKPLESHGGL